MDMYTPNDDLHFYVTVLKSKEGAPEELLEELRDNATHIKPDIWIFEGDWELCLEPWLRWVVFIKDCVVPSLGGLSDEQRRKLIRLEGDQ